MPHTTTTQEDLLRTRLEEAERLLAAVVHNVYPKLIEDIETFLRR